MPKKWQQTLKKEKKVTPSSVINLACRSARK
jgi:hypothetical protein